MAGIAVGIVLAVLAVVYLAGVVVFSGRFWPQSTMGAADISLKTPEEVQTLLEQDVDRYSLTVKGLGVDVRLSGDEAGVDFDAKHIVDGLFSTVNAWTWPLEVTRSHDETESLVAELDEGGLSGKLREAVDAVNETATPPVNAYTAFNEEKGVFAIVPEEYGTQINYDAVTAAVAKAVSSLSDTVTLTDDELSKPSVLSGDPMLVRATADANALIQANLQLTMAGEVAATVDAATVAPWVTVGEDLSVSLDEEAMTAWVDEIASSYSTVSSSRTYTRADGSQITVPAGSYGWKVDRDALLDTVRTAVETSQAGSVELPCSQTAAVWNGVGARDWGSRYVDVDLSAQHATFYGSDGSVIWESDFVSGKPRGGGGSLTPAGVYTIGYKASPSTLKGTNDDGSKYETPVQYWMPFVGNLIGFHDANWQSAFGGSRYRDGFGSHGCLNLPVSKAQELYGIIESGDVVVSHW